MKKRRSFIFNILNEIYKLEEGSGHTRRLEREIEFILELGILYCQTS